MTKERVGYQATPQLAKFKEIEGAGIGTIRESQPKKTQGSKYNEDFERIPLHGQ